MDDISHLVSARQALLNDFFGGWEERDAALLEPYRYREPFPEHHGEMVDWLGIRTDLKTHAWLAVPPSGFIHLPALPFPDDRVHAETIEYIALVIAVERALARNTSSFTAIELGASYGPWITAAGVLAKRSGFKTISLTAVEASEHTVPTIVDHARRNGLDGPGIKVDAVHAAVHVDDAPVYFPRVDVSSDNGAQMATDNGSVDYRGVAVEYDAVPGVSFTTLCAKVKEVDFCHLDLQGAEERLLNDAEFLATLDDKVATFFLATQSRLIEGMALRAIGQMGWRLVRERPTVYAQNQRTNDINGWAMRDGGQIWLNPRFGTKHFDV